MKAKLESKAIQPREPESVADYVLNKPDALIENVDYEFRFNEALNDNLVDHTKILLEKLAIEAQNFNSSCNYLISKVEEAIPSYVVDKGIDVAPLRQQVADATEPKLDTIITNASNVMENGSATIKALSAYFGVKYLEEDAFDEVSVVGRAVYEAKTLTSYLRDLSKALLDIGLISDQHSAYINEAMNVIDQRCEVRSKLNTLSFQATVFSKLGQIIGGLL